MFNVRLSGVGSVSNCHTCGRVMSSCEGHPCATCNRFSHEGCMVVIPSGTHQVLACRECLARYVDQRRERDHSHFLLENAQRQIEWNRLREASRNAGAAIHAVTQGVVEVPFQFARGVIAGNSIHPLAQMQSLQPIQPGRDLLPEGVGRPQEGRRQQSLLQTPDAHQGRVQPVVVGRAIEQGGMTA